MEPNIARERAEMPAGTHKVLDKRTLATDNKNLLKFLKADMHVLDVGCGSGSITKGIAEHTGPGGKVTGIDPSENLVALARNNYADLPHLQFLVADINTYAPPAPYDIVTAARVLQWLANPAEVLLKMRQLLKAQGLIAILDYNHEKINWHPAPPAAMQRFYDAFLQWRKDAGFDNAIADHLPQLFSGLGFRQVSIEPCHELTQRGDPDFAGKAGIWSEVAATRGHQLVKDNYITEDERLAAITAYDAWIAGEGQSMQLYLLGVSAVL